MKKIIQTILCLIMIIGFTGCKEETVTYNVNYYDINGNCVYTAQSEAGLYNVDYQAQNIDGYTFNGWLLNGEIVNSVNVNSDINLYPNYLVSENEKCIVYTNEPEQYVEVGEKTILRWYFTVEDYSGNVDVYNSDETVLKVDNQGNCEGLKEGKTDITVVIEESSMRFSVLVVDPNKEQTPEKYNQDVFRLLSDEFITLTIGKSSQINMEVASDNPETAKLVYISDFPDVVAVNQEGLVKAIDLGSSVIRVSTSDYKYNVLVFVNVDGKTIDAQHVDENHRYSVGEHIDVHLTLMEYKDGHIATSNGYAYSNLEFIIDEGPDVFSFNGSGGVTVIESFKGEIKAHFKIGDAVSNIITIKM